MNAETRLPPFDSVAEQSTLALIMETGQPYRVTDRIRAEDFYSVSHQTIYRSLLKMDLSGPIDTNSVHLACKSVDPSWDDWSLIREIHQEAKRQRARSENLESFADTVKSLSVRRQYIAAAHHIADTMASGELNEMPPQVFCESTLKSIHEESKSGDEWFSPFAMEEFDELMAAVDGVPTGFRDFDRHTNGMCAPDLVILTGEPGSGKTTLATNIMHALSLRGASVAGFSMEMSRAQFTQRLIAGAAGLDLKKIRNRHPDVMDAARREFTRIVDDECIFVGDRGSLTIGEIKSKCLQMRHRTGRIDLVMIDYLGRGRPDNASASRNEQMAQMVRDCKTIAKDLSTCVLLLAQLNREGRLRDSGEIDAEADTIIHIETDETSHSLKRLQTKKARHAEPGSWHMTFDGSTNRFIDYIPSSDYAEIVRDFE